MWLAICLTVIGGCFSGQDLTYSVIGLSKSNLPSSYNLQIYIQGIYSGYTLKVKKKSSLKRGTILVFLTYSLI